MTLNNEEERRAWVAFAAGCAQNRVLPDIVSLADALLETYRMRLPKAEEPTGPDWSTAPEWAEWWAQDLAVPESINLVAGGYWYECEPIPSRTIPGRWTNGTIDQKNDKWEAYTGPYVYPGDWRDSLQRRPKT